MNFSTILFEKKDQYALITLNRTDKLNALNKQMFDDLNDAVALIEKDNEIKALVITGSGEKAFAAGADIKELNVCDASTGAHFSDYGSKVFARIEKLRMPVIAAVNGFALGGGCELAMACHIRFASENAKFGQPEVNLGIIPGYGGTQRLTNIVGKPKSIELIASGILIDANEAYRIGLANQVYPLSNLMEKTLDYVKIIISKSPIALSAAIDCVNAASELPLSQGLNFESVTFGEVCGSEDFKEGTTAFLEKRPAVFKGN